MTTSSCSRCHLTYTIGGLAGARQTAAWRAVSRSLAVTQRLYRASDSEIADGADRRIWSQADYPLVVLAASCKFAG
jgi:hypothetical protein